MESENTVGSSDRDLEQTKGDVEPMGGPSSGAQKSEPGDSVGNAPSSRMRIDPYQLLNCLKVLLDHKGGIRSNSEVKRVAGLMAKYSKKLVSKCIYINILGSTDKQLLDEFYNEAGWDLVCAWLTEAVEVGNWPLTEVILELLEISPVNVDRLKQNNAPKIVKELSREGKRPEIKVLSEKVLEHWKVLVGVSNAAPKEEPAEVIDLGKENTNAVENTVEEPVPQKQRRQPVPSVRRGKRGVASVRGKRRRGRPTKAEALSYAQLLNDGIEEKVDPPIEPPIKITIKNVPKLLADSEERLQNRKFSAESTDSDDVPLINLRKPRSKTFVPISSSDESEGTSDKTSQDEKSEKENSIDEAAPSSENEGLNNSDVAKEETPSSQESSSDKNESQEEDSSKNEEPSSSQKKDQTDSSHSGKDEKDSKHSKNSDRSSSKKHKIHTDSSSKKSSSDSKSKDKHKSSHKDKSHKSSRDKKDLEKHRSKDKSSSSSRDKSSKSNSSSTSSKSIHDKNSQAKKDQATLNKVKPFSTEGLAKIPKKPTSFLDALSAADEGQDVKRPAVKTKSRGFRNSGLLDDIEKPGVAGKRSTKVENHKPGVSLKRPHSLDSPRSEKKMKPSVSSDPVTSDRPGGVKLMSPKRPAIADDGGFMAALTAAGSLDRKKIPRKRRNSETDKNEKAKIPKTEPTASPSEDSASTVDEPPQEATETVAPMNFYKDTLSEKLELEKKHIEEDQSKESEPETETPSAEETPAEEPLPEVPTIPAPAQEDYETIDVLSTPVETKGVLVYHRPANRPKKSVKWKQGDDIRETFYFPMDENERVNVNNIKFQDMIEREKAKEKEMMGRNRLGSPPMEPRMPENSIEFSPWKLYPILLKDPPSVIPGCNSNERHVQAQREQNVMGAFFNPAMLPETPSEPDPELTPREEPPIIPLTDVTGSDIIKDLRDVPWPEAVHSGDPSFAGPPLQNPHDRGPNEIGGGGGHWVVGSHQVNRFGVPMFNGPNNPNGGSRPPFPGPGFNDEFRGRWVQPGNRPPGDFRAPPMMMPGGPPMPPMGPRGPGLVRGSGPGPRFKRNNWGPPNAGGPPRPCFHFMNGHCRNGSNCRFGHSQPR